MAARSQVIHEYNSQFCFTHIAAQQGATPRLVKSHGCLSKLIFDVIGGKKKIIS
jgi:hypothetical protein